MNIYLNFIKNKATKVEENFPCHLLLIVENTVKAAKQNRINGHVWVHAPFSCQSVILLGFNYVLVLLLTLVVVLLVVVVVVSVKSRRSRNANRHKFPGTRFNNKFLDIFAVCIIKSELN